MTTTGSWIFDGTVWRGEGDTPDIGITTNPGGGTTTPPSYRASGAARVGTGSVSVPWPTGHASGDIGILIVETASNTVATPTGWTAVHTMVSEGAAGGSTSAGINVFWRRATSSSESNVSIPDSGDHNIARMIAFSGCIDTGSPIDANFGVDQLTASSTIGQAPSFTTTTDNTHVVAVMGYQSDSAQDMSSGDPVNDSLTGLGIRTDTNAAAGFGGGFIVASGVKEAAGSVDTTSMTLLRTSPRVLLHFALLPMPATSTPTGSGPTMFGSEGFDEAASETCGDTFSGLLGSAVTPDSLLSSTSASTILSYITTATANGAHIIIKPFPANNSKNGDGTFKLRDDTTLEFSTDKFNAIWDAFWANTETSPVDVTAQANAAVGATSLTVSALAHAIPIGGYVEFGGSKYAKLTAAAASGATTLTVAPLTMAITSSNSGTYSVGHTQIRTAVANGVVRALYILDDFVVGHAPDRPGVPHANQFTSAVGYTPIETISAHIKADAPWLPLFARGNLASLRGLALLNGTVRKFQYLDCAECAYRPSTDWRRGAAGRVDDLIQAGKDCDVAPLGWNNILNWGKGDTTGWGCITADVQGSCGESPAEILAGLRALANRSEVHGIMIWAYNFGCDYWHRSEVQAAFATIASEIASRVEGPINIRTGASRHLDAA
jgi:hypothetical protein